MTKPSRRPQNVDSNWSIRWPLDGGSSERSTSQERGPVAQSPCFCCISPSTYCHPGSWADPVLMRSWSCPYYARASSGPPSSNSQSPPGSPRPSLISSQLSLPHLLLLGGFAWAVPSAWNAFLPRDSLLHLLSGTCSNITFSARSPSPTPYNHSLPHFLPPPYFISFILLCFSVAIITAQQAIYFSYLSGILSLYSPKTEAS